LRQRIVGVFGKNYNQRLVPLEEEASLVKLKGFIGKPEFAKKTRGEQFFFVNNRFIKNGYLHHAVQQAFQDLIPKECQPSYYISLEMDASTIDVNIHPTKTEIKFENDRAIYAILLAAVKQSLGKYNISPMLDFTQEHSFEVPPLGAGINLKPPEVNVDPEYNPFNTPGSEREQRNKGNWEELFIPGSSRTEKSRELDTGTIVEHEDQQEEESQVVQSGLELEPSSTKQDKSSPFQLRNTFVVAQIKSGLLIMHQQHSSERIKYEIFMNALKNAEVSTQQKLFTQTIDLTPADFLVYKEIENEIKALGFNIRDFGKNSLIIEGIPAEAPLENADRLLENILEQYKDNAQEIKMEHKDNLARSLARNTAVKAGVKLEKIEMTNMIDQLFACEMPYYSPYGHPTVTTLTIDELMNKFENQY
jgi:DNA mismatch repair protein MutL